MSHDKSWRLGGENTGVFLLILKKVRSTYFVEHLRKAIPILKLLSVSIFL